MAALSTFPSPRKIAALLSASDSPSVPSTDLATLEDYFKQWPYPKSLDYWEGYVYADLCLQVGWAYLRHDEYEPALAAWRICPWPDAVEGERQALAHLLQIAYEEQSLIIGPPVGDLLNHGRIPLGSILATLDDPSAVLGHAASGIGYVLESRIVQPDGLYHLRCEFDHTTLFYVSFLPAEVHSQLLTARAKFQMDELTECASWLLRAAFVAQARGLGPEAFSFLEKALQMSPENQAVQTSLTNLRVKGVGATFFSRVVIERTMFQPDPVKRCEIRPDILPDPDPVWLDDDWVAELSPQPLAQEDQGKVVTLGVQPMEKAKFLFNLAIEKGVAWPLLVPSTWQIPGHLDLELADKRTSCVRGMGLEKLGLWKGDYRPVLAEMVANWPSANGQATAPEVIDFALPNEVQLVLFGCSEVWQIPTLLDLELPELKSVEVLAAWWRRLQKNWEVRPFLVADDVIWFQLDDLPDRRELFLADLLSFSSDVAECFEPEMIRASGRDGPYLFPVPMQLSFLQKG
jgi:hypothetical protein